MTPGILALIVLALTILGYILGRRRAVAAAEREGERLHSLPGYYGQSVALFTAVPAFLLMAAWLFLQPLLIESQIGSKIPESAIPEGGARSLVMADVRRIADGLDFVVGQGGFSEDDLSAMRADISNIRSRLADVGVALGSDVSPVVFEAAKSYRNIGKIGSLLRNVAVLAVALGFGWWAWNRIRPSMRARNISETFIRSLLLGSSLVAILTTAGIVVSLLFETIHFFQIYPARDFFFSTVWNPQFRGGSDLGILPLLWGTFYVSLVALVLAVPIGLMVAIYLAEYAGSGLRSFAKPADRDSRRYPDHRLRPFRPDHRRTAPARLLREPLGLGTSSSEVMTAGLVMGIMLIPFVSSLSDDIINAVPQAMRDGSYGLGATQSETIKQVILPAALPGIVGAILLAASRHRRNHDRGPGRRRRRRLSLNPFEAMTTVTVKIVSQLTGDTDFESPEALVAFALGLTLFVMTLGLNVLALYIVRKYREQYE
jgi:phosphate transport system permease protein